MSVSTLNSETDETGLHAQVAYAGHMIEKTPQAPSARLHVRRIQHLLVLEKSNCGRSSKLPAMYLPVRLNVPGRFAVFKQHVGVRCVTSPHGPPSPSVTINHKDHGPVFWYFRLQNDRVSTLQQAHSHLQLKKPRRAEIWARLGRQWPKTGPKQRKMHWLPPQKPLNPPNLTGQHILS